MWATAALRLAVPLLPPISDGLDFHQTHEGAAEAAGSRVTEAQCDVRNALVGLHEQVASRIETNFRDQFTVAGTRLGEMTLQRAGAQPELARGALKRCVTVAQRRSDRRSYRVSGWQTDRLHRHVVKGWNPLPLWSVVVPANYE